MSVVVWQLFIVYRSRPNNGAELVFRMIYIKIPSPFNPFSGQLHRQDRTTIGQEIMSFSDTRKG